MKIEMSIDNLFAADHNDSNGMDNNKKVDITDLVTEQLKVKVPEEMPWEVYEEIKNWKHIKNLTRMLKNEVVRNWFTNTNNGNTSGQRQLAIARAMQYGFKLAERKFRVPLKGFESYVARLGIGLTIWRTSRISSDDHEFTVFTESELKDLNAPDWIMKMPREYVEE